MTEGGLTHDFVVVRNSGRFPGAGCFCRAIDALGGEPGLLDLAVGFTAAYASFQPGLIAALPGVAIGAELVPPIATSRLALSFGDSSLAIDALPLFVSNRVTIFLASMAGLWLLGMHHLKGWSRLSTGVVVAAAVGRILLLIPRPQAYELAQDLSSGLVQNVLKSIGTSYDFESLVVAYDELGV